ncbi:MAG TPA: YetF domain-containing protein [Halomicronema sp.]
MYSILKAIIIYFFLLITFRLGGKRSLAQITTFDFVLVIIISETIQNAMVGEDYSLTNAFLLIITMVAIDVSISIIKERWPFIEKLVDGVPLIILEDGRPLKERMKKARVGEDDIMQAARELQGLERMEQIKYAVLERSGSITIIPK